MARIRTIKPEFPQSESMGRVSRESRLCFILLWTLADDAGRLRGNSRMLASLLYPYDDDAAKKVPAWLSELEREQCICRYEVDGDKYIAIENWSQHQKIDKPSLSKIPEPPTLPREDSSSIREDSRGFSQGERGFCDPEIKNAADLRKGREGKGRDSEEPEPCGFVSFWNAYPNRSGRRKDRKRCLAMWEKNRLEPLAEKIVAHVESMKALHWRPNARGESFEPGSDVYLRNERWNDGPVASRESEPLRVVL